MEKQLSLRKEETKLIHECVSTFLSAAVEEFDTLVGNAMNLSSSCSNFALRPQTSLQMHQRSVHILPDDIPSILIASAD